MEIENIKYDYLKQAHEIAKKWQNKELDDSNDESRAGGFWDLAMELAEMQLPENITDKDLELRDGVATLIYYSFVGTVLND